MAAIANAFGSSGGLMNKFDYLAISKNDAVMKAMAKFQKGNETVLFSDYIVKINPRDKPQERVLVITDQAMYNLLPLDYPKCKRRISLSAIDSITVSKVSDEFVIHVPDEYDYRMMSLRKRDIIDCLDSIFSTATGRKLHVEMSQMIVLKALCVTKGQAKKIKKGGESPRPKSKFILKSTAEASIPSSSPSSTVSASPEPPLPKGALKSTGRLGSVVQFAVDEGEKGEVSTASPTLTRGKHMRTDTEETVRGWGKEYTEVTPNDFKLLKVVGRGSFGKVMLVNRKTDGVTFAMKVLKKQAIIERNQVEHTKAEREILEEIDHPFLMKLEYAFQTKTKLYFVMQYLTGGELFFHLKNARRFDEARTRFYTAEIALGLGHLHSKNIIYRDLKPENILLDSSGHIKLTDFGLSKKFDGKMAQTFCGTPEYLAPEVILGVGHGKAVDWWSLGILVYEMLVGIPPFYSENVNLMYDMIQQSNLRIPSIVSTNARQLICGLLVKQPRSRLGSGKGDVKDILGSLFFGSMDFDKLMRKEISPSFIPKVKSGKDTSNFDAEFTNEPAVDSLVQHSSLLDNNQFENFTYVPKSDLDADDLNLGEMNLGE